jgi:hypothetical protein
MGMSKSILFNTQVFRTGIFKAEIQLFRNTDLQTLFSEFLCEQ